ncbi:MAG: hypothetical protein U5O39_03460 [Gammaproteobacteria bacterium]|nr:hypothetical protein [Gammaproteobacteria bacterium]
MLDQNDEHIPLLTDSRNHVSGSPYFDAYLTRGASLLDAANDVLKPLFGFGVIEDLVRRLATVPL